MQPSYYSFHSWDLIPLLLHRGLEILAWFQHPNTLVLVSGVADVYSVFWLVHQELRTDH